jgi:hypothetical protein
MYPASAAFKSAVITDHIVIAKAEVWNQDQRLTTLNIDKGSVKVDAKSAIRRTCSVHLVTDRTTANLVPDSGFDTLTPFGNELRLYRGIQFSDGTEEYVPLGVFIMTDIDISDSNEGVEINIEGEDRSLKVSRNKWLEPYQVTNGSLEDAIEDLLKDRFDDIQVNFPTTNVTINQVVLGAENENDPWKDAVELCELVGFDLFFDPNGIATMRQFPSLDGAVVVASYVEGVNNTITSIKRNISSKETYNGVIYTLEGSEVDTPVRVEAWDEDTTSPTYRFGVFGEAPTFITSNLLATEAQALTAAYLLLNRYIGAQESIGWNGLVDPTLDANDVVYIRNTGAKVDRVVIIDSLDIPLAPEDQLTADARVVRVIDAGQIVQVGA